jgi:hypothetical protein
MRKALLATACLALFASSAYAQTILNPVTPLVNGAPAFTASNPGNITGSFTATLSGFTPGMTFATLTAAGTSGSVALPAGTVVAFQNTGSATVSCTLGVGSAAALANEIQVPASSTVFVTVGSNTFGACIDQTGSTSNLVVLAGGSGLGTGFGGGGGGGSGGNVTIVGPLGQALAAASVPVILPAATIATLTPPAAITGFALEAGNLATIAGRTPALGQALAASSTPVVLTAIQQAALTPPTSVGVNNFPATQPISAASGAIVAGALANGASVAQGSTTDAPCTLPATATACSQVAIEKAAANQLNSPGAISQTTDGTTNGVRQTSQYPSGATAVQGSNVGTTAATATTLAATASITNFVCQISIRANATAAATGNATLSDGTKTYNFTQWTAPAASGLGVVEEIFNPCYPASAVNTAWTLTSAAPGTGGVVSVAISGYQK